MEDPLDDLDIPNDEVERLHMFARDLAYLVITQKIISEIKINSVQGNLRWIDNPFKKSQLRTIGAGRTIDKWLQKWGNWGIDPPIDLLISFGYLDTKHVAVINSSSGSILSIHNLTPLAFQLLKQPIKAPTIFISYRRVESSAFALLLEARFRLVGINNVFIDRDIRGGSDWESHIHEKIEQAQTFIIVIGKQTLTSDEGWVEKEIGWAVDYGKRIIPIWHNQHSLEKQKQIGDFPIILDKNQGYTLRAETALEYETAINWLLNTLGYRTY